MPTKTKTKSVKEATKVVDATEVEARIYLEALRKLKEVKEVHKEELAEIETAAATVAALKARLIAVTSEHHQGVGYKYTGPVGSVTVSKPSVVTTTDNVAAFKALAAIDPVLPLKELTFTQKTLNKYLSEIELLKISTKKTDETKRTVTAKLK